MKYLIITSAGGAGHITIAKAQRDTLLRANKDEKIEVIDIMGLDVSIATKKGETWIPTYSIPFTDLQFFSGRANVKKWDSAQKMGGMAGVRKLEKLIDQQYIAEAIQGKTIYNNVKKFIKDNPDLIEVIDTQALSTPAICRAVTEENERRSKLIDPLPPIKVKKIVSEFLTDKAVHFLRPLSHVAKKDAACLTVEIANSPLRASYEVESTFYCRHNVSHIRFEQKPASLRAEFLNTGYAENKTVYLKSTPDELITKGPFTEQYFMQITLGKEATLEEVGEGEKKVTYFKITKNENDKFFMISLGSQSSVTILRYIDACIEQVTTADIKPPQRIMFFVAAGKNEGASDTMYYMVRKHLEKRLSELKTMGIQWPDAAKIIPLSYQDDKSMASMFQNTDVLITRTGGMSSIEANETQPFNKKRKVYIHSEAAPKLHDIFPKNHFDACHDSLLPGTVRWEGGNAQYLMNSIDACLTSPDTVRFNIDSTSNIPHYKSSLIEMASSGRLNQTNFKLIQKCLMLGSNPNMEALGGLPVMAYATDIKTIKLCINYGGKMTKALLERFRILGYIKENNIKELQKLSNQVQHHINSDGAPKEMQANFINAVKEGSIDKVKGLLYRYPKLAFIHEIKSKKIKLSVEQIAMQVAKDTMQDETLMILQRAKGATQLHLALPKLTGDDAQSYRPIFKRMIYLNQDKLNVEYPKGVTPITLCTDKDLRLLMVQLGANPDYNQGISKMERVLLKKVHKEYEEDTHLLKKTILKAYKDHKENETRFCTEISAHLATRYGPSTLNHTLINEMSRGVFGELKTAKDDIARMTFIEKFINLIKYLFGADITSRRMQVQASKLLFYRAVDNEAKFAKGDELRKGYVRFFSRQDSSNNQGVTTSGIPCDIDDQEARP